MDIGFFLGYIEFIPPHLLFVVSLFMVSVTHGKCAWKLCTIRCFERVRPHITFVIMPYYNHSVLSLFIVNFLFHVINKLNAIISPYIWEEMEYIGWMLFMVSGSHW